MRKKLIMFGLCVSLISWAVLKGAVSPYHGWMNEYDGMDAHTLALWNCNEDQVAGHAYTPNVVTGASPYLFLYETGATYEAGGKFGWGFRNRGGTGIDQAYTWGAGELFPSGADPSLSIECWVKLDSLEEFSQKLFDKRYIDNCGYELQLIRSSESGYYLDFYLGNGTDRVNAYADLSWEVDRWYHVAGTWDAATDTAKVFRDGVEVGSVVSPGMVITDSSNSLVVGNRVASSYAPLNGMMDDIRISNIAYDYAVPEPITVCLLAFGAMFLRARKQV